MASQLQNPSVLCFVMTGLGLCKSHFCWSSWLPLKFCQWGCWRGLHSWRGKIRPLPSFLLPVGFPSEGRDQEGFSGEITSELGLEAGRGGYEHHPSNAVSPGNSKAFPLQ